MSSILSPAAAAKVEELLKEYKHDSGKVVPIKEQMLQVFVAEGACKRRKLHSKQVAVHPANRDGQMITASGVYDRGVRLNNVGFSLSVLEKETFAIEENPVSKHIAKTCTEFFKKDARFAEYKAAEIIAGSLGASHTNHFIATVFDKRPCDRPEIADEQGKVNSTMLCSNADFKAAVDNGIEWWVIRWEIEESYPEVATIFQSALNAVQHVGEGEGWVQLLYKIEKAVIANTNKKGATQKTDWDKVVRAVLKSNPKMAKDVPFMIDWFKAFGGGTSQVFVKQIGAMFDKFVPPQRKVSGNFFKALGDLKYAADQEVPAHFVNATLVVHAAANENVSDDYAKFIKNTDVDSISVKGRKYHKALEANTVITRAWALAAQTGLPEHQVLAVKFRLLDRLVRHVFKYDPNRDAEGMFSSVGACGAAFVTDLMALSPAELQMENPWLTQASAPSTFADSREGGDATAASRDMINYDEHGQAVGVGRVAVQNQGFEVNTLVVILKGKADEQYKIIAIADDGTVELQSAKVGNELRTKHTMGDFLKNYRLAKEKVELLEGYPGVDASISEEYLAYSLCCQVGVCVFSTAKAHPNTNFEIQVKPIVKVTAKIAFEKDSLKMVPATNNITMIEGKSLPRGSYLCVLGDEDGEPKFALQKPSGAKFVAPIWRCKVVSDKTAANCEVSSVDSVYKCGAKNAKVKTASVPIVMNFKPIAVGDEIVVYDAVTVKGPAVSHKSKFVLALGERQPKKPKSA